ncbi:MAG TPA: hypothetical protein VN855_00430 [Candidatus Acidoferrum sp.]|nr:hypothetical protein [Candidatus Acidoferrum sp.]
MNRKIIGIGIVLAIIICIVVFVVIPKQESPPANIGQNLTSTLPTEGKHLQLSINESVGIKTLS